jgi:hypothetical protein
MLRRAAAAVSAIAAFAAVIGPCTAAPPAAVAVTAVDQPWDNGQQVLLRWTPAEGGEAVKAWRITRTRSSDETIAALRQARIDAASAAMKTTLAEELADPAADVNAARQRARAAAEAAAAAIGDDATLEMLPVTTVPGGVGETIVDRLAPGVEYRFELTPLGATDSVGPTASSGPVTPTAQLFYGNRLWLALAIIMIGVTVGACVTVARNGRVFKIRRIAGLEALDEAIGRATEMGRPVLYIPGIQDMDNVMTVAGVTILGRVAKVAAEYDARLEVPTARSLVMTACRESVQSAYFEAGRSDAFNPDTIRYITDEQFGYVAYVAGRMVRDRPATCIYMGQFYAESLLLAENGNSIGAIQIAGTAESSQLPFFVAACDYTLIGEEFFAASAYLSGEATQIGSVVAQDVIKLLVVALLAIGVALATAAALGSDTAGAVADYLVNVVLKG